MSIKKYFENIIAGLVAGLTLFLATEFRNSCTNIFNCIIGFLIIVAASVLMFIFGFYLIKKFSR